MGLTGLLIGEDSAGLGWTLAHQLLKNGVGNVAADPLYIQRLQVPDDSKALQLIQC